MQLVIDTTEKNKIVLTLQNKGVISKRVEKDTEKISENLLPTLEEFLRRNKIKFAQLKNILVNSGPGGFSSTRTGVATANALNFVLGVNKIVLPVYDKEPNITTPHPNPLPQGAREKRRK